MNEMKWEIKGDKPKWEDIPAKTEHSKRKRWWKLVWKKNMCITR
jgi:hypothetical protein